jgi:hypothetical protein
MGYIVTRSFYQGDDFYEQGREFTSDDSQFVEQCLEDGNIQDSNSDLAKAKALIAAEEARVMEQQSAIHAKIQAQPEPVVEQPTEPETVQQVEVAQPEPVDNTAEQIANDLQIS